ncbi:hypothetical protein GCM10009642_47700 [Nocardiopsis metallicus]
MPSFHWKDRSEQATAAAALVVVLVFDMGVLADGSGVGRASYASTTRRPAERTVRRGERVLDETGTAHAPRFRTRDGQTGYRLRTA